MLSTFRMTAIGSIAALSLALVGASAPAYAQIIKGGGGGFHSGGFHSGGGFNPGGGFNAGSAFKPAFNGGSNGGFSAGGGFNAGNAFKPAFNGGAFRSATAGSFAASSGFQGKPDPSPGGIAGGDWHHLHHHHDHDRFGFVPFGFAYYGGYPYYDNNYAYDYSYDDCIEYRHVYDRYGNYLGDRPVNIC